MALDSVRFSIEQNYPEKLRGLQKDVAWNMNISLTYMTGSVSGKCIGKSCQHLEYVKHLIIEIYQRFELFLMVRINIVGTQFTC